MVSCSKFVGILSIFSPKFRFTFFCWGSQIQSISSLGPENHPFIHRTIRILIQLLCCLNNWWCLEETGRNGKDFLSFLPSHHLLITAVRRVTRERARERKTCGLFLEPNRAAWPLEDDNDDDDGRDESLCVLVTMVTRHGSLSIHPSIRPFIHPHSSDDDNCVYYLWLTQQQQQQEDVGRKKKVCKCNDHRWETWP